MKERRSGQKDKDILKSKVIIVGSHDLFRDTLHLYGTNEQTGRYNSTVMDQLEI